MDNQFCLDVLYYQMKILKLLFGYFKHDSHVFMSNRHPKAIVMDQAKVIQNGVERVFPESRYRWCLWHIMKKIPEKFGGYDEYDHIKAAIGKAVYDSLTITEFEVAWMHMLEKYDLGDNEWLKGLYRHRHRWVPAFVKDAFWAGFLLHNVVRV